MRTRPPIKIHGGKYYLAPFIIGLFPKNYTELTYCEPFCGGASVFWNKERSASEVLNDLDDGLISIFKALRDEPKEFIARLKRVRYTERTFAMALNREEKGISDYVDKAVNEFILRRMSRGGLKKTFAWSDRLRGGKPGDVNAWETIMGTLPLLAERLQGTILLHEDFRKVTEVWDEEDSLTYLDPPYLHSTRTASATSAYQHELSIDDHVALLNLVKNARGKVIISGYQSSLYTRMLDKERWRYKKKPMPNHASQSKVKSKRVECVWLNY